MLKLIPTNGILIFIGLYIYAASIYPGGSPVDPNSIGFDWFNNLWCNLMSEKTINGLDNPASPISIFAAVVLCVSMIIFFFLFVKYFVKSILWKILIKSTGVLAMVSAAFIFTTYHDIMTTILSICGLVGISGILRALHLNKMHFLKGYGFICFLFIGLNNWFYYKEAFHAYLPVVQQMDIFLVLSWTVMINLKMRGKEVLE